jgi:HTH-type transcriptional regulator/antitoxin HipB
MRLSAFALLVMTQSEPHRLVTAAQLGQLLRSARKKRSLTQADVAGHLGLSQNRVSYLESHPEDLSFRQLLAWSAALGLELSLGEQPPEPTSNVEW